MYGVVRDYRYSGDLLIVLSAIVLFLSIVRRQTKVNQGLCSVSGLK